jgi:signal transduction histidine kinase
MLRIYEHINVLIVEDNPADAFLIKEFLDTTPHSNFSYHHCHKIAEAVEILNHRKFEVVLMDFSLPDSTGLLGYMEVFRRFNHIPFIILTGLMDEEISIEMLNQGATDYLIKGEFNAFTLRRSIFYAIERSKLEARYMQEVMLAQDKEKERIARDVHDSIGQNLTSISMQLQQLKKGLNGSYPGMQEALEMAEKCTEDSIQQSRGIARSLMPQTVEKFGLESGIESIIMTLGETCRTHFRLSSEITDRRFPSTVEVAFFRIAQECINNIIRYSEAYKAQIKLLFRKNYLIMLINDNGKGFDLDHPDNQKGIGLPSIRNRAKSIDGDLSISSHPGKGTTVRLISYIAKPEDEGVN